MTKGGPSFGKHNKTSHMRCRRCGRYSYHMNQKRCSACGFPDARMKKFAWQNKTVTGIRKKR